ncbi:MAG: PDZ domain-containing protein [SAR202 cluster bacterium]|nr:PDZ domain-containing protein [SAR202 cluster bacterium]
MRTVGVGLLPLSVFIALALVACASLTTPTPGAPPANPTPAARPGLTNASSTLGQTLDPLSYEQMLERVYAEVSPSVVNIDIAQRAGGAPSPFGEDRFEYGNGSGFVWDKSGHIVTNNHVIDGASRIRVTFFDGATVEAVVVGADPDSDLAVIRVDMPLERLRPIQTTDSTVAQVGQLVVAIGNPFGLQGTMTTGIVSGLGRSLPATAALGGAGYVIPDIIQTDAAINPGNSGGVLVDMRGRLLGVTSAIISPVRASAGVGFAIPTVIVNKVVAALIADGRFTHSWFGISMVAMRIDIAREMGLPATQRGVLIVTLAPDGPAARAGLRAGTREVTIDGQTVAVGGDVLTAVDGVPIPDPDALTRFLARSTRPGQDVVVTFLRDGLEQTATVTIGERQ